MRYSHLNEKSEQGSRSSEDFETEDTLLPEINRLRNVPISKTLLALCVIIIPVVSVFFVVLGILIGRRSMNPNAICPSHVQKYCQALTSYTLSWGEG
jgi:hypothetical protein